MVRAKRISDNTASAIVPIFIILSFLRFYIRNTTIQDAITIITFSAGFFLPFFCSNNLIGRRSISIIVVSFFSLCGIFVSISGINETRQSIFLFLSHLGIVLFISEYKISSPRDLYLLNLSLLIFFLFHALIGADPNDIFTVSRNYISVLLLLSLSFYIYSCQNNNKHPSIYLILMTMAVLLWAIGRAGIASGAIILAGSLLIYGKIRLSWLFVSTMTLLAYLLLYGNFDTFLVGIERFERLSTGGLRDNVNDEYIRFVLSDLRSAIFGVPLLQVAAIQDLDGNPHNSFIRLHALFGLIGFLGFLIICIASLFRLFLLKKYYVVLVVIVSIFRSCFDSAAFHGPLDLVIFYGIFLGFRSQRSPSVFKERHE